MKRVWLLITNSLNETIRQKMFLNLVVFGILMVAFAQTVGNLTYGRADRVVRSIGLGGVALALDLLAVLIGVAIIHREFERRTALVVLTRPVTRGMFIVGRFGGLALAVAIAAVGFAAIFVLTLFSVRGQPTTGDFVALSTSVVEAWIMGAFAVLLSTVTTPSLGTGIALGFWIACSSLDDVVALAAEGGAFQQVATGLSYVFPSFSRMNFREAAVYMSPIEVVDVLQVVAYGLAFVAIYLVLATLALSRKEIG